MSSEEAVVRPPDGRTLGPAPRRRLIALPFIVAVNVVVYLAWWAGAMWPPAEEILFEHFTTSWAHLRAGHVWTLLTAVFSHAAFFHFLINMLVLTSFASVLEMLWGPWRFLRFYLAAGFVSSLVHGLLGVLGWPPNPALGASGAVAGVILVVALLFPRQKLLLFGIVPVPAWIAVLLMGGFDLWGLVSQYGGGGLHIGEAQIGHGAHLGGAAFGLIYYLLIVRPRLARHRQLAPPGLRPIAEVDEGHDRVRVVYVSEDDERER